MMRKVSNSGKKNLPAKHWCGKEDLNLHDLSATRS
jgi:hypothetical protein